MKIFSYRKSINSNRKWALLLAYAFLLVFVVFFLFPPYYMLITSLKSNKEIAEISTNPWIVEQGITLSHYIYLFTGGASKNSKGEALTNKIGVDVNVKIILAENNFLEKNFNKTSIYTVINRKSEQKLTENKLIENLSNEIAQQVIFEISKNTK